MSAKWPPAQIPACVHGSAVNVRGCGVLVIGPAGSGKSSFALQLMAYGAVLISDDLVWIDEDGDHLALSRPPQASGSLRIEARGVGILRASAAKPTPFQLLLNLSEVESSRLPEPATVEIAGHRIPYLKKVDNPAFPAMVLQYLLQHPG